MFNKDLSPALNIELIRLFAKYDIFGQIVINVKTPSQIRKAEFTVSIEVPNSPEIAGLAKPQ